MKLHNRVAEGFSPPAPTTPCMRIRTGVSLRLAGPNRDYIGLRLPQQNYTFFRNLQTVGVSCTSSG